MALTGTFNPVYHDYHWVKPISEWQHYDCHPKPGIRPRDSINGGEPCFDIHDVEPRTRRGHDFLEHLHEEARRNHNNRNRSHMQNTMHGASEWEIPTKTNTGKNMSTQHMNETQTLAVALLDNFTTVECYSIRSGRNLTFKKPKDLELEEGDMAICSFHDKGFDVLEVKEVHKGVVNPDDIKLAWIAGKVDLENLLHLQALDQKAVDKIKQMQQNKARKELLAEFDEDELKTLGKDLEIKKLT